MPNHTTQTFIPIQFDKSHLSTIGERLYTQSLDLIRELVANAYDADATSVKITVGDETIAVEDNGIGMDKEGLKQYFTIGSSFKRQNPISPKLKRVRIGEFGIGKFAVLSICNRFEIYTRSQNYAATLIFDREDFERRSDWNIPLIEHNFETLTTGTRVSLFDIKKSISLFDIERHLINVFPLSDKKFSVFLNNLKLQSRYIPGERFRIREKTKFGIINGDVVISSLMLNKETVGIGIRVKGILIKRETFGIEKLHSLSSRRLTGEINADFLTITASRDDFIKDTEEYKEFEKVMAKKLVRVVRSLEKSALSYQDKKAEKILSDALVTVREALKKNRDILFLEGLPLFSRAKSQEIKEKIQSGVIATALSLGSPKEKSMRDELKEALKSIRPKVRSRIKTLLRDDHRVVKKVKIGGSEFLVSFAHLGEEEKESFAEGGVIFINRDHLLFKKIEGKGELILYHLIRLVAQEIIKLANPRNLETGFDWHGRIIKDAFLSLKGSEK